MLEAAFREFGDLTGRRYGLISQYRCEDADIVLVMIGSFASKAKAAVDALRMAGQRVGLMRPPVVPVFCGTLLVVAKARWRAP